MMGCKSFITGSYAYGTPTKDSDIDLVVLVSQETIEKLRKLKDDKFKLAESSSGYKLSESAVMQFGKLNLLCVTSKKAFKTWKIGTEVLRSKSPVTREEAVDTFKKLRKSRK